MRKCALISAYLVLAMAIAVLVGWLAHVSLLIQLYPTFAPMQFNTALCFVLAGSALIFGIHKQKRLCLISASLLLFISILVLIEYIFNTNTGIDQLFMYPYITTKTTHPGRMAPNTAICFILVGLNALMIGLTSFCSKKWIFSYGVIGTLLAVMSFIPIFGYITGLESAYGWGGTTRMALHTAMRFALLTLSLYAFIRIQDSHPYGHIYLVPAAFVLFSVFLSGALYEEGAFKGPVALLTYGLFGGCVLAWALNSTKKAHTAFELLKESSNYQLKQMLRRENLLHQTAALATEDLSLEQAMRRILFNVCKETGWPVGHLYLLEEGVLVPSKIWYLENEERFTIFREVTEKTIFKSGEGLPGIILQTGKPIWNANMEKDPNFFRGKLVENAGVRGAFGFPIMISGKTIGVLEFFSDKEEEEDLYLLDTLRDIGKEASLVIEKHEFEENLRKSHALTMDALRVRSEFLAMMSHEIRTPLHVINGAAEQLESMGLSEKQMELVKIQLKNGEILLTLVNDLLDLSKMEAGQLELDRRPFNAREMLDSLGSIFQLSADTKGLIFSSMVDDSLPNCLVGDPKRIEQVLINLLGNAIKYTREGSVKLRAQRDARSGMIEFSVKDTGVGIEGKDMEKIFYPFKQVGQFSNRQFGGSGLGLNICKRLVALMDGEITVESALGVGSTFTVRLPLSEGQMEEVKVEAEPTLDLPLKILLVDDSEDNCVIIKFFLENTAVELDYVLSGEEALKRVQEKKYDLVLLDILMPVMDGKEVARRIRKTERGHIAIIAFTAFTTAEEKTACLEAGCDGFITKPVKKRELFLAIHELLGHRT
ncbi:MAG: response regulator [Chlamydiales bacterium]|nr:response regulator [Chlamydiales bacterium]